MAGLPHGPSGDASDERLVVDAAREGDEAALSELYTLYFPRVYRYILARTGDQYEAEDLAEEVFMHMLKAIDRFQWREVPFSAWLFRIAHNALISQRRKNGTRGRNIPLTDGLPMNMQGPEELVANRMTMMEVMAAAQRLPDAQRNVISLRFAAGLSVAETAKALGKAEGNVKVTQHKAIAKLREMLREQSEVYEKKA